MRIQIDTSNGAFEEAAELARVLRELAGFFAGVGGSGFNLETLSGPIRDINGNTIGRFEGENS